MQQLRINEIFFSIQGESVRAGIPTTFIRLSGCPLRCTYCDTEYAFKGGKRYSIDALVEEAKNYPTKYITISGGEPLAQKDCWPLMTALCDEGFEVSLETSGAFDIADVDPRVMIVMDLKTPASNEEDKNLYSNIPLLKSTDQIKFVICDREDYLWSKALIKTQELEDKVCLLMSPEWENQSLRSLANWILEDGLKVRYQVQLHKVIWPNSYGPGV